MNRTLPAPVERAEGNHLHDPSAGIREGCAGVVGPGRRHDTIYVGPATDREAIHAFGSREHTIHDTLYV